MGQAETLKKASPGAHAGWDGANGLPLSDKANCCEIGRRVIRIESEAVRALEARINESFERAVEIIFQCRARVVITGIGKSGLIGKKIAATLSSTGTPAIFLHAAEGLHGDLGAVMKDDVVICISKSGNNEETKLLVPLFRKLGVPVIALTGNLKSALARDADVVLDISVREEACPNDLAPTASSAAMLAMGDALAVALLARRNFSPADFALRHPGGTLGRRLLLRIDDLMGEGEAVPVVGEGAGLDEIIPEISKKRYGATCVTSEDGRLLGIITDGDLRRMLSGPQNPKKLKAIDIMSRHPKTMSTGTLAVKALEIMEDHNIMQLIIVDDQQKPVGIVHLHDLLKAGVA